MVNSATISIIAYCSSSILMTVTNKMVLSQFDFNMNFLLLAFQARTYMGLPPQDALCFFLLLVLRAGMPNKMTLVPHKTYLSDQDEGP